MPLPRLRLPSLLPSLLTTSLLAACADDAADPDLFPGRVPCASEGAWDSDPPTHRTFAYDADQHLLSRRTVADDGTVVETITNTWVDGRLATSERQTPTIHTRSTYTWDGDLLTTYDRTDLALDDGDNGFTMTNTYRDGVQLAQRFAYHDASFGGTLTTITGDDTTRATWRECAEPADGSPCTVSVWEQPDRDPAHWTRGTFDTGEDGTIDDEFTMTYDAHFLPLVMAWNSFDGTALAPWQRDTSTREADGTETRYTIERLPGPASTYVETFAFTCAAARPTPPRAGRSIVDRPARPLALVRRDPTRM
ncbi:MAG: hypothetical protein IPH44_09020 [Myxococcales bacterium]|nr:hypothetical protein [Myxococcales bacterium]MBK7198688.1 hypothetical protein [Myxococcales bacterium]